MVLDGVLADRSVTWLGSEREKRRYFKQHLGDHLRDDEDPRLVFGKGPNLTVRYFPDKLPIGYDRDHRRHVFMYLARSPSPMDLRVFILRHLELLNALGFWCDEPPDECETTDAHPASHVLFAPGDAWGASKSHPGTGRTPGPGYDAALHAPEPAALDAAIRLLETGTDTSRVAVEK